MLGRLTLDSFTHDIVQWIGIVVMVGTLLAIVAGLAYFKKLKWLYKNWLTSLDAKKIGVMYIIIAVVMLLRGVMDAVMIRSQQVVAGSGGQALSSDHFQQVFSAHGTIMIFFAAMGLMFGIINLILPLQLGARDVAFPLLNSISFWLFAGGMILINISLIIGEFTGAGWLAYPPLSGLQYSPGVGVDYWLWSIQIAGIGSLLSGVNFITTILKCRAPGLTLKKMSIFAWSVLSSMTLVMFAFPVLTVTLALLSLDRTLGTHFFTTELGGNPMMYINLIWAWGHPEVYILILPAFGIFSEIVPVFSRKKLFGRTSMIWALISITVLSFIVWLHHFFTMGSGGNVNAFFGIMTAVIGVPTGVKVFNWIFTMWKGRVSFTSPMYWFFGFVATFVIGGITGVMMSIPAIDFQVHNSLFLVAHFHNMIIGGVVFGYMAGISYWFPKMFGFKLHEKLGKLAASLWIVGFVVAFVPLYVLGIMGATRRMDSYDPSLGWQSLFIVSGVGIIIILAAVGTQVLQIAYSIYRRKQLRADNNPWDAYTLEWATASPAPEYNFAILPTVEGIDPLWDAKEKGYSLFRDNKATFEVPNNTSHGMIVGLLAALFGFTIIWHMYLLSALVLTSIVLVVIVRSVAENTERTININVDSRNHHA